MIIAKFNPESSTEVCSISGVSFYNREGLSFYVDGNPTKPVRREFALMQGFTMSEDLANQIGINLAHAQRLQTELVFDD